MKLYTSLTSPFGRKVRIVCLEKRIDLQLIEVATGVADSPVNDLNPLGKVPTLILDDHRALYDSSVIVDYLDHVSPVGKLIPADQRQAIGVKRWEALADGMLDAAIVIVKEHRRPAKQQSAAVISHEQARIDRGLAQLSTDLGERKWCTGETFTVADVAVGCLLTYLNMRFPALEWQTAWPNLLKLQLKLAERPSFIETAPPPPAA
ncbi:MULTISPECIES: glutathione S-transferase N-terminal domain-containing protein [Silvimonas]|uniref:glutathione S-transferase N-terminal domain-containing protein n=1 Tax=Silvimonas TaxID=300264 RepID=UPI0024B37971|nr:MULTISPECIES: glutathione S-transferase N-terminal domain-containing protein [Silvimonas]MDR3426797.1 glutathione S-transferase N-terminal domain-containing protein [Silvimonas sp.]